MVGWVLVGSAIASAWEPASSSGDPAVPGGATWVALVAEEIPRSVAIARWAGRDVVLAASGTQLEALDARTGASIGRLPLAATDVTVDDLDGDGQTELVVCGPDGVDVVPPTWPLSARTIELWAGECSAIGAAADGDRRELVVRTGDRVIRLDPTPGGVLERVVPGDERSLDPAAPVPVRGGALVPRADPPGFALVAPDGTERFFPAGAPVGAVAAADLDGDGCEEVVIASADRGVLAVARGSCGDAPPVPRPAPTPPRAPAAPAAPTEPVPPGRTYAERLPGPLRDVRCDLGLGYALGAWDTSDRATLRSVERDLGEGEASGPFPTRGVLASGTCAGGGRPWRWVLGGVSVPAVALGQEVGRRSPDLVVVLGAEWSPVPAVAAGPVVEAGLERWAAVGGRARWSPVRTRRGRYFGVEVRALGVPGAIGGGYGALAFAYDLGRHREIRREAW